MKVSARFHNSKTFRDTVELVLTIKNEEHESLIVLQYCQSVTTTRALLRLRTT